LPALTTKFLAHEGDNTSARAGVLLESNLVNEPPVGSAAPTDSDADADWVSSTTVTVREPIETIPW